MGKGFGVTDIKKRSFCLASVVKGGETTQINLNRGEIDLCGSEWLGVRLVEGLHLPVW